MLAFYIRTLMKVPVLTAPGLQMPMMGFGTSHLEDCAASVAAALRLGYRLIDTARKYGTETGVGTAIAASGVPRSELFVVTKVSHEDLRADAFARSVDASLKALNLDYVDLLLVNWPNPAIPLDETMHALAAAKQRGHTRHIGVCNFNSVLLASALHVCPEPLMALQAEYHFYLDQNRLLALCREAGLIFMAYCPVRHKQLASDPVISAIAQAQHKTNAQIALRWLIQQGNIVPIPRSANPRHMAENLDVFSFTLSDEEMTRIFALKRSDGRLSNPRQAPRWD